MTTLNEEQLWELFINAGYITNPDMARYIAERAIGTGVELRITDAAYRDYHGYVTGVDGESIVLAARPDSSPTDRVVLVPLGMVRQFGVAP